MDTYSRPKLNFMAILYIIFMMSLGCFFLLFMPIILIGIIKDTIAQGTIISKNIEFGLNAITTLGFLLVPSFIFAGLRNIYRAFPWLLSFIIIFLLNTLFLCIAVEIINKGYEVHNPTRHSFYIALMLTQVIICRLIMCCYLYFKPIRPLR